MLEIVNGFFVIVIDSKMGFKSRREADFFNVTILYFFRCVEWQKGVINKDDCNEYLYF